MSPAIIALGLAAILGLGVILYLNGVFGGSSREADGAEVTAQANDSTPSGPLGGPAAPATAACQDVVPEAELGSSGGERTVNRLVVGPQASITWNGAAVNAVRLRQYLDYTAVMNPRPMLTTRVDPAADPAATQSARDAIVRALGCSPARL